MLTTLITGANRGIGLEMVRQYSEMGWHVIATCRNPDKADALHDISMRGRGRVDIMKLDVADFSAIESLSKQLKDDPIDLLMNNAGVLGAQPQSFGKIDYDDWAETLRVNTLAPMKIAEQFSRQVAKSKNKMIVNLSSWMGSISENNGGGHYIYRSSKAALNMVTRSLARDLRGLGIIVVAVHPGWVRTDMGGDNAPIDVQEAVTHMRRSIAGLSAEDSGAFINNTGAHMPC